MGVEVLHRSLYYRSSMTGMCEIGRSGWMDGVGIQGGVHILA